MYFVPLNPLFSYMQVVIALATFSTLLARKKLVNRLFLITELILVLDLSAYFIEIAPRSLVTR